MNSGVPKRALKTSYRASPRTIHPIYTGGPVLLTNDGEWLITTLDEEVVITQVETGLEVGRVKGDSSAITSLALSYHTSPPTLITCHMSMAIRYYPLPDSVPNASSSSSKSAPLTYERQLSKAHSAPILVSTTSSDSTMFASGSSDGMVKVWDSAGGYVTHLFRGHGGPVSALKFWFSEDKSRMELWTGSTDGRVRVFDLRDAASRAGGGNKGSSKPKHVLEGHVSVVRGIDLTDDGRWAVTGGRDQVALVWDISGQTSKSQKLKGKVDGGPKVVQTIIAQEQVESVGFISKPEPVGNSSGRLLCYTGGDQGLIRVWDVLKGEEVMRMSGVEGVDELEDDEDEQRGVLQVIYDTSTHSLVSVHADQNIIFHSLATSRPTRHIIGFNDEIIDSAFLSYPSSPSDAHSHLALATNSSLLRLYSTETFDAQILSGHQDMVLCLNKSIDHHWLVSGGKDMTARIWAPSTDADGPASWRCIAVCEGHAESVGAVAFNRKMDDRTERPVRFLVTASQDRTLKLWDLSSFESVKDEATPAKPKSLATIRAHEKDINSIDVSPNDRLLASGSQDKLVKIFEIDFQTSGKGTGGNMRLVGTCKGHRRGVWTVKFSPTDRIVASGAADRTVRLWSLDDYTCLKTFEGHTNSVLRVDFLTAGMQLLTSSSDGLVKLWNIKDEECVKTLDNHDDKVWALAVSSDEKTIVSAGADSIATFWEDSTEIEQEEKNDALVKAVQTEQAFTNYVALKDYRRAISLALAMSQPGRLLSLFTTIFTSSLPKEGVTGSSEIDQIVRSLSKVDLARLLRHVRDWNANARTSSVAQAILNAILRLKSPEEIMAAFDAKASLALLDGDKVDGDTAVDNPNNGAKHAQMGLGELLDGLIPYSERHFARIERLAQDSYVLDYVVGEMDGGVSGAEVMDIDGI